MNGVWCVSDILVPATQLVRRNSDALLPRRVKRRFDHPGRQSVVLKEAQRSQLPFASERNGVFESSKRKTLERANAHSITIRHCLITRIAHRLIAIGMLHRRHRTGRSETAGDRQRSYRQRYQRRHEDSGYVSHETSTECISGSSTVKQTKSGSLGRLMAIKWR